MFTINGVCIFCGKQDATLDYECCEARREAIRYMESVGEVARAFVAGAFVAHFSYGHQADFEVCGYETCKLAFYIEANFIPYREDAARKWRIANGLETSRME